MSASAHRLIRRACSKAGIDSRSVKTTWAKLSARDKADMRRDMERFVAGGDSAFAEFVEWRKGPPIAPPEHFDVKGKRERYEARLNDAAGFES